VSKQTVPKNKDGTLIAVIGAPIVLVFSLFLPVLVMLLLIYVDPIETNAKQTAKPSSSASVTAPRLIATYPQNKTRALTNASNHR
jgi:hypothetical protein